MKCGSYRHLPHTEAGVLKRTKCSKSHFPLDNLLKPFDNIFSKNKLLHDHLDITNFLTRIISTSSMYFDKQRMGRAYTSTLT